MISNHAAIVQSKWLAPVLDHLESLFWGKSVECDSTTASFYVFKPYPSSLKIAQYQDWGRLQSKTLSPFENGESYVHLSRNGVSVWAVPESFKGIPETAMQEALPDGQFIVKGERLYYEQHWKNGVMQTCRVTTVSEADKESVITLQGTGRSTIGWAVKRNIDTWLSKPVTWYGVAAFIFISLFIWELGGTLSHVKQLQSIEAETTELEERVGDKLAQQNTFLQQQNVLSTLSQWQNSNGFLPQTLAKVAGVVLEGDNWQVDNIEWQGKRLVLQIQLNKTEISTLVSRLEQTDYFSDVSIRPNSKSNFWELEVVQK